MPNQKILISGAGLCGSLLALRCAQRGYEVTVYEKRPDLRKNHMDAGRSINLALSNRGIQALHTAGINTQLKDLCLPMHGRMIHSLEAETRFSPYSGRSGEYINSVSRPGLNMLLLNELDKYDNAEVIFGHEVTKVDLLKSSIILKNLETQTVIEDQGDILVGADGAGSAVRRAMSASSNQLRFSFSQEFLSHGYKEIEMPANHDGTHKMDHQSLHIWPRTSFMMIALPNTDGSFTMTMFHPFEGYAGFDTLHTKEDVLGFFNKEYPDLLPLIPNLLDEYFANPTSNLATIKCNPWQSYHKTILMGDAAHAIVPFYGQGMNASFEDVLVFDQLIDKYSGDWSQILPIFEQSRIPNANAIADLAVDNFYEMRDHVDDPIFIQKRKLETQLEQTFPNQYYSKYSMVTFREDMSYKEAMVKGRMQDKVIMELCKSGKHTEMALEDILHDITNLTSINES